MEITITATLACSIQFVLQNMSCVCLFAKGLPGCHQVRHVGSLRDVSGTQVGGHLRLHDQSALPWQGLMEAWTARESPTAEQQASPVSSSSGSPGGADGLRARLRASRSEVYCILQVGLLAWIGFYVAGCVVRATARTTTCRLEAQECCCNLCPRRILAGEVKTGHGGIEWLLQKTATICCL